MINGKFTYHGEERVSTTSFNYALNKRHEREESEFKYQPFLNITVKMMMIVNGFSYAHPTNII
jgi:hypothetical protein